MHPAVVRQGQDPGPRGRSALDGSMPSSTTAKKGGPRTWAEGPAQGWEPVSRNSFQTAPLSGGFPLK